MARVRAKDTKPEVCLRSALFRRGLRFRKHVKKLPGKPDVVFVSQRIAVFVDGGFWHGYEFEDWKDSLTPFWRKKIGDTIERDQRTHAALHAMGWTVLRIWQHDIETDLDNVVSDIYEAVKSGSPSSFTVPEY